MKQNTNFKLTFKAYGNAALLIEWPQKIAKDILFNLCSFHDYISSKKLKYILELNYVYCSLLIIYNKYLIDFETLSGRLKILYGEMGSVPILKSSKQWKIPVCYDDSFGIDLILLEDKLNMSKAEIIKTHSNAVYTVYGIGFLPGFLYLGGLSPKLHISRKAVPDLTIEAGSIGIAGQQTGIYPQNSPGGWHIIGKTPISIFNPKDATPVKISPGDSIQFYTISMDEFEAFKGNDKFLLKLTNND